VRADFAAFLDQADRNFLAVLDGQLFQPDRRAEARRASAYDHDVEFHGFALHD